MAARLSDIIQTNHTFNLYTLSVHQKEQQLFLTMSLKTDVVETSVLPQVSQILQTELPTIFRHACFNDAHQSFAREVKATALGHLFEHILLEYLLQARVKAGRREVKIRGETNWDWNLDKRGTFYITIAINEADTKALLAALVQTIHLFDRILPQPSPVTEPVLSQTLPTVVAR